MERSSLSIVARLTCLARRFRIRPLTIAAVLVLGVAAGAAAAVALPGDDAGGQPPPLDVPQTASAADQGIVLSIDQAAFSGTGTFLQLTADFSQIAPTLPAPLRAAAIPSEGLAGSTILAATASGEIGLPIASGTSSGMVRFQPVTIPAQPPPSLDVSSVRLLLTNGETRLVTGKWHLALTLPDDISDRLRTERLIGKAAANDQGIEVVVLGGQRSTSETLVTVSINSADKVSQLGQPALLSGSGHLPGGEVSSRDDGRVVTFSFPPTAFGSSLSLEVGPFKHVLTPAVNVTSVDVGGMLRREPGAISDFRKMSVAPGDIVSSEPSPSPVLQVSVGQRSTDSSRSDEKLIVFVLDGNFEDYEGLTARGTDGRALRQEYVYSSYRKDVTGAVSPGTTEVSFEYSERSAIDGVVELSVGGAADIIYGRWAIDLAPVAGP